MRWLLQTIQNQKIQLKDEEGQSLIQVALMLVVLIGFVALAVDVGNAYAQRRRMQNAADAGALAGAYELCKLNEDEAEDRAVEYMEKNGVAAGIGDAAVNVNVVSTTARANVFPILAQVVGAGQYSVTAQAAAACGAASSACGLWPLAFNRTVWDQIYDNGGSSCNGNTPVRFAVWSDDNPNNPNENGAPQCSVNGVPSFNLCNCWNCSSISNGNPNFMLLSSQGRAWLDFREPDPEYTDQCSQNGCGTNELRCRIENDSGGKVTLPSCILGEQGVRASVRTAVEARADVGDVLSVPLYDSTGCTSDYTGCGQTRFHVSKLGCIKVIDWLGQGNNGINLPHLTLPGNNNRLRGRAIIAEMRCSGECTTSCGSTNGEVPEPWELTAANLIQ